MIDRINYAALKVGDPMFLAEGNGWSSYRVTEYTVAKISPKGQITCKAGASEIRVTPRGSIIGDTSYSRRSFVTSTHANELQREALQLEWFNSIRKICATLDKASRQKDFIDVLAAFNTLEQAIKDKPA